MARSRASLARWALVLATMAASACTSASDPGPSAVAGTIREPPSTLPPFEGWVDPASAGAPYGDQVEGLLTFRGNPTRTYYGEGPVPRSPRVVWTFPDRPMCGTSSVGGESKQWCGTGWTGQPAVWEREGRTWVAFGAYDKAVHFVDGETGERLVGDFPTGDIIKGSVTVDPDGYPLLYTGSRDGRYRVLALDRPAPTELWALSAQAVQPTMWNDDWDGAGLVLDDHLFVGGENSQFHIVRLNRGYGAGGLVTVAPELVFNAPGWDEQVLSDVGDRQMSIENSVAISGDTVYFANSGGLVQGWDVGGLRDGREPERVFRFWAGDDIDGSVVVDAEGLLYVGVEFERGNARAREVGQIIKLDPRRSNPILWSVLDQGSTPSGVWATPALHRDLVIVPTHGGRVLGIDRDTGAVRWEKRLPGPTWSSPVVVDDVLLQGDCAGVLHAYDVSDTGINPPELWSVALGGCIESTPAVWKGRIYVGTRGGFLHAIGEAP